MLTRLYDRQEEKKLGCCQPKRNAKNVSEAYLKHLNIKNIKLIHNHLRNKVKLLLPLPACFLFLYASHKGLSFRCFCRSSCYCGGFLLLKCSTIFCSLNAHNGVAYYKQGTVVWSFCVAAYGKLVLTFA